MRLSDQILTGNAELFNQMLDHPFVAAICADCLPKAAYRHYLVYEGAFVRTAIAIFAYATAKSPDLGSARWLIGVQRALAEEQMPYFERAYASLGIDPALPLPAKVVAFDHDMLRIAREGDFLDIMTAMFAAEWMYWTWCSRAAATEIGDPHIRDWVALHADEGFAAQARWLKNSIDTHARPEDLPRLTALFAQVMKLEIAFHDAPLEEDRSHA